MSDTPGPRMRKFSVLQSISVLKALVQNGKRLDEEINTQELFARVQWDDEEPRTEEECAKRLANIKRDWVHIQSKELQTNKSIWESRKHLLTSTSE